MSKILGEELGDSIGVKLESAVDLTKIKSTIYTSGQSLLDVFSLVLQSHDLDFIIVDGKIVIDSRRAIEKRLDPEK